MKPTADSSFARHLGLWALLLGCGGAVSCSRPAAVEAVQEPHVVVHNQTGTELMEIRWIDADGKDWGDQSLVADYLAVGAGSPVRLPPGAEGGEFAITAVDPDGREIKWPLQAVTNGQKLVLSRP